jgi:hypothetical protein
MPGIKAEDIAPGQEVEIDFLRPQDAEGVTSLFRAVYGEGYPHKIYYDPKVLSEENAAGRTISCVARTPKGDIVGHAALFQPAPCAKLYESGAGLVLPSYRHGAGIFKRMMVHSFQVAPKQFGLEAIFGDVILNHPYTQRTLLHLNSSCVGLQVDLMPAAPYSNDGMTSGRVASLVTINIYKPHPQRVYIPEAYQDVLRDIYGKINDHRELAVSRQAAPPGSVSRLKGEYYEVAQVARIQAPEVGEDFTARFAQEEQAALAKGALVLQAWLDTSTPWLGQAVAWLRGRGYFLGGVVPRWFDHDALFLQKILHRPHWEGIVMEVERGKELMGLVRQDWERSLG